MPTISSVAQKGEEVHLTLDGHAFSGTSLVLTLDLLERIEGAFEAARQARRDRLEAERFDTLCKTVPGGQRIGAFFAKREGLMVTYVSPEALSHTINLGDWKYRTGLSWPEKLWFRVPGGRAFHAFDQAGWAHSACETMLIGSGATIREWTDTPDRICLRCKKALEKRDAGK